MSITIKLDTKRLEQIARDLDKNVEAVVEGLAFEIEAKAKQLSPYDTGALSNSIYTVTKHSDGYAAAAGAVAAVNPEVATHPLPKPSGKVIANVGPSVEYAAALEFGHLTRPFTKSYGVQRFVAARPYLAPAVEQVYRKWGLPATWREVVE